MSLGTQISSALKPMVDLAYPPRCPLCGDALGTQDGLCLPCWAKLEQPGEPACVSCQRPIPASLDNMPDARCAPCLSAPPRHAGIAAATLYNDASRKLVLSFKHGRRIALARMMARLMAARLGAVGEGSILVPVPLHRWRLWRRGYNQSALLAGELAKLTGIPVSLNALERHKATPSLGGLGKKERKRALQGSIRPNARASKKVEGASVILVDDVMTSGATADACIAALLKAGAREVKIACFARVVDGDQRGVHREDAMPINETPEIPYGTPGAA